MASAVLYLNKKEAKRELKVNFNNELPVLLLRTQKPRRNVGQVVHVSPTPLVTSQTAHIAGRIPEAVFWLRLRCWNKIFANSNPSPGTFNNRVLRFSLVSQCSHPPYWPRHQRRLVNCDWMPAAYTSGQPSNPRRHPTCWASSYWSHTAFSAPCHETWTSAPLSAHPPIEC